MGGTEGVGGYIVGDRVSNDCGSGYEDIKGCEYGYGDEMDMEMAVMGPLALYHWKRVVLLMQTEFRGAGWHINTLGRWRY